MPIKLWTTRWILGHTWQRCTLLDNNQLCNYKSKHITELCMHFHFLSETAERNLQTNSCPGGSTYSVPAKHFRWWFKTCQWHHMWAQHQNATDREASLYKCTIKKGTDVTRNHTCFSCGCCEPATTTSQPQPPIDNTQRTARAGTSWADATQTQLH